MGAAPSAWIKRQTGNRVCGTMGNLSADMQQRIYATIRTKLEQGKFVHYDPLRALEENARPPRQQTLSYADYYARYHTTEPRDGWQMANPTGQKVIYVRNR